VSLDLTTEPTLSPLVPSGPTRAPADNARADGRTTWSPAQRAAAGPAVARDLDRLIRVLAEPVTPVRRTALVGHVGYLADQLRTANPALAARQAGTLSRLRKEARRWSREPARRAAMLAASEHAADVLAPSLMTADRPAATSGPWPQAPFRLRAVLTQRPTALAFRHYWLLDDLPPHLAEPLHRELTGPARWLLRNVFSGGYNRRAFLMWVGGGSGPAL
jgi:hypothetical protein